MTAFRALYTVDSFKNAFEKLVALDPSSHAAVADAVRADSTDDLRDDQLSAGAALRTIRDIAERESAEAVLNDIAELCPPDTLEKLGDLIGVLTPTESELETRFAADIERTALPVLTHPHIFADFRATDWRETGEIRFAPVAVVRLVFDEAIGGNEAIVFQASLQALLRLRDEIGDSIDLITRATLSLPTAAVPAYYREWLPKGAQ